jgi:TatD DNase family protein
MIDCHCHLEYMDDSVIEEAKEKGMTALLASIADISHKEQLLERVDKYPGFVHACFGFHPEVMVKYTKADINNYIDFIRQNKEKITAVGEVGLDYNWTTVEHEQVRSRNIFADFVDLAKELDKPLVIHSRNGQNNTEGRNEGISDTLEMLAGMGAKRVMLHCFSGSEANLRFALDHGWFISYATVLVKSFKHQRLAKETPLDRVFLETDSPWLDPDTRELVNRPWKIERSAEIIAEKKNIAKEEVLRQTTENAKKFFNI